MFECILFSCYNKTRMKHEKRGGSVRKERLEKTCKIIQWVTYMIGFLSIIIPIILWNKIPQEIPAHYGASGVADRFSDKGILFLLFIIVAVLMGMMGITTYVVRINAVSKYAKETELSQSARIYPVLIFMNFTIQCVFAYVIFCCCTSRNLGKYALFIMLLLIFAPVASMLFQRKKYTDDTVDNSVELSEHGIVYRSKVDWWLALLLGGSLVYMAYLTAESIIKSRGTQWFLIGTFLITFAILVPLLQIKYIFYSQYLLVSCGIYGKVRIAYGEIRNVKETKNPLSSAALSLDRIQIDYEKNGIHQMVLISPVQKKEFLKNLEKNRTRVTGKA